MDKNNFLDQSLEEILNLAKKIGSKHYHRLTSEDFEEYCKYNHWRYIGGDGELGVTQESKKWVQENSTFGCPICEEKYHYYNGRNIDHKLPRSKYPWLSMDFRNLWVICSRCNREKLDMDWFEYELYILKNRSSLYSNIAFYRPRVLLEELKCKA
ncbi:HNH endonuclease signature motif containing protein [Picosynechococcus sp. NKBG15041c]|uniref:HNH endonuclease signature motif containing protein n=1 Tax=Picosynechococcus sp. NKBG15041c TaxID=1407650 RepID=UPI0004275523|nr:HNH endonuclease signature motif containing protein [Picosynechococcus sp. NKBG15041c]